MRKPMARAALVAVVAVPIYLVGTATTAIAAPTAGCDFNGNGRDDLAIAALSEDSPGGVNAGAVSVYSGLPTGITGVGVRTWSLDSPGVAGVAADFDVFGTALACGDFNGDGRDDLAVGIPLDDNDLAGNGGSVSVLYAGANGLIAARSQLLTQSRLGVAGGDEDEDWFGSSLASGDFNGDGRDDLAIGVPLEDVGAVVDAGAVALLFGSAAGLAPGSARALDASSAGVSGSLAAGDQFGFSLAAGDFNGDGRSDLAVGSPFASSLADRAGQVTTLIGLAPGAGPTASQLMTEDSTGIVGVAEGGDSLGWSLAAGDVTGDGRDDLAIGTPFEDGPAGDDVGMVHLLRGGAAGLVATGNQLLSQGTPGVLDDPEAGDQFGYEVALGDVNGDGRADLIVGVPREDVAGGLVDAGAVAVLRGSPTGLVVAGNQSLIQSRAAGTSETSDLFGLGLVVGDFNGDGRDDLAAGAPFEDVGGAANAGAVTVIGGSPTGLRVTPRELTQVGQGGPEEQDLFGSATLAPLTIG